MLTLLVLRLEAEQAPRVDRPPKVSGFGIESLPATQGQR